MCVVAQVDIPGFECGDVVRMISDMAEAYRLQKGHGEWNDDMALVTRMMLCVHVFNANYSTALIVTYVLPIPCFSIRYGKIFQDCVSIS